MNRHPNLRDKQRAQQWARELFAQRNFYVLDTETTGTGKTDEVVQIGIVDKTGAVVLNTLVKPTVPVSSGAARVHGITKAQLQDAPTFDEVYVKLSSLLAGAPTIAYNMPFDWRMLSQTARRYKLPNLRTGVRHCAMRQYATYRGVRRGKSYRWHKLTAAATYEKIAVENAHDALGDVRMTLALIQCMAEE